MKTDLTLTIDRLREVLDYDAVSGEFRWRHGDLAGYPAGNAKRVQIMIDGVARYAHRMAWAYVYGVWPANQIDHIDGDKQNNSITNLREATNAQNKQNAKASYKNNAAGRLGVGQDNRSLRWRARIMVDGTSTNLGTFDTADEASAAYLVAKRVVHPFWAA